MSCTQVMLPYYTSLPPEALEGLEHVVDFECPKGEEWDGEMRHMTLRTSVHRARIDGIPVLLVAPANRNECNIFRGDRIYGGSYNELEAYLYFSRCVRQDALRRDFLPPTARRAAATGILRCPWHEARNAWLLGCSRVRLHAVAPDLVCYVFIGTRAAEARCSGAEVWYGMIGWRS